MPVRNGAGGRGRPELGADEQDHKVRFLHERIDRGLRSLHGAGDFLKTRDDERDIGAAEA